MLLKQITLTNFRQFKGKQTVVFSEDSYRNVTVIMGENGSGKTTLAQAFKWCLYNQTDFCLNCFPVTKRRQELISYWNTPELYIR